MQKWELEVFFDTHLSEECVGVVWSERSRVTQSTPLLARAPRWRESERTQQKFFKQSVVLQHARARTHTHRLFFFLQKPLVKLIFGLRRHICFGWTGHVACARAERSSGRYFLVGTCGSEQRSARLAGLVCLLRGIRCPPVRTGHHAPAVYRALDHSCTPVWGRGTVLQRSM